MKLNASTITTGNDYKLIKIKSLKPLYMPNIRSQILFQRTISLYNNKKISKKRDFFNKSITIKNFKGINNTNKSSSISKKSLSTKLLSNSKIYNNIYDISKITSLSEKSKFYLSNNKGKRLKENKKKNFLRHFSVISGFNTPNFSHSLISEFNRQSKLFNIKKLKLSKTKYWLNESKNNNDYTNEIKISSNSRDNNKCKLLNKSYKKELKVEYYKWFI